MDKDLIKLRIRDQLLWGLAIGNEIIDQIITGGSRAYHVGKLFNWTPTKYSRKKYRGLVSRLVRKGYVQKLVLEGVVSLRITEVGRRQLVKVYPVLEMAGKPWDGFWRIVIFVTKFTSF